MLDIKDLVTLSDNNRYLVTNKTIYNKLRYYLLVDIDNNKNIKVCYENKNEDKLELIEVDDEIEIQKILLLFTKNILNIKIEE